MIAPASRKVGKYDILQKLGRGGMADVYLAQDTVMNRTVALKLIEHSPDTDTCDFIEAERRGVELQARLSAIDPRVVKVFDSGDVDGFFFVAMEYIDGQDLSELMRRGPLTMEFAADVAIAVAATLDHAHTLEVEMGGKEFQGIVHGDIKPKNIRIDAHGEVRVLDFGIAKALSLSRRLTHNEFGSVPYGSPERLDTGEVNIFSDLWSLAVMLYEMVTGLRPYHSESTELLERMIRSRIPPPPAPDPCPEPLRRILMKAMAPEPEARYQSGGEFAADLQAFRRGETVRASLEDIDATRRTARHRDDDQDETRRTNPADETRRSTPAKAVIHMEKWPPAKTRKPLPLWVTRTIAGIGLVLMVWVGWAVATSINLYRHGQQLDHEIAAEQLTDLNDIWNRWTELSLGNSSSWLLHGPRKTVKQKFVAAADHVIDRYRNSEPVTEAAWKGARDNLARALSMDPDESVRGKLRLSEGHLERISGINHHSAPDLNLAVEKFEEAQHLMPNSPDPQLGLAIVYVYGLKDIDKAYQALEEAAKHGYALSNRDRSQLADGYRDRADRMFWDSRNVRGLPQEKDEVQRAKDDYQRALELYQKIAPYGKANTQIVNVQNSLESVDTRLQQIEHGTDSTANPRGPVGILRRVLPPWTKPFVHLWQ